MTNIDRLIQLRLKAANVRVTVKTMTRLALHLTKVADLPKRLAEIPDGEIYAIAHTQSNDAAGKEVHRE